MLSQGWEYWIIVTLGYIHISNQYFHSNWLGKGLILTNICKSFSRKKSRWSCVRFSLLFFSSRNQNLPPQFSTWPTANSEIDKLTSFTHLERVGMIFMNNFYKLLKRDHVQFNLFNSIINVAAEDWFLFASNPTGRCFSHSFDLLSVQHGTYILQMLLRIYTRSLHQNIFFFSSMKKNIAENFVSILLFLYAYKRFEDWR